MTTLEPETTCVLNRMLEIFNTASQTWILYSASLQPTYPWITAWIDPVGALPVYTSSINGFTVTTTDFNTFDNENRPPSVWQLRMKVQDGRSTSSASVVYDYFNIEIKY